MVVYTDSIEYAESIISSQEHWQREDFSQLDPHLQHFARRIYVDGSFYKSIRDIEGRWTYAFIVQDAPSSQFDLLIELNQRGIQLPEGIICLAGTGRNFHGHKGRPWAAHQGNIHLTVYLTPQQKVERFHVGFLILAAVSLVEAIDTLEDLRDRANIKWVNDVLINRAKVAGFLAHTSSIEERVTAAVLGIGLNVETTPRVPADVFVPKVASLRDFIPDPTVCNQKQVLERLLYYIDKNYEALLSGRFAQLLDVYRGRSLVMGRKVKVLSDTLTGKRKEIAAGRVKSIGENLELILEHVNEPVTKGRLILMD